MKYRQKVAGHFLPLETQWVNKFFALFNKNTDELLKYVKMKSWRQDFPSFVPFRAWKKKKKIEKKKKEMIRWSKKLVSSSLLALITKTTFLIKKKISEKEHVGLTFARQKTGAKPRVEEFVQLALFYVLRAR